MIFEADTFQARAFAARLFVRGGGAEPPAAPQESPTGGWEYLDHGRRLRRVRAEERERLRLSEADQRRLDRAAKKIARDLAKPLPQKAEGLIVSRETISASPQFDALLMILRPTEGEVMALAQAIFERVLFLAEQARLEAEDDEMLLRIVMEL